MAENTRYQGGGAAVIDGSFSQKKEKKKRLNVSEFTAASSIAADEARDRDVDNPGWNFAGSVAAVRAALKGGYLSRDRLILRYGADVVALAESEIDKKARR